MEKHDVTDRLGFARRRMLDLQALDASGLLGTKHLDRQQLLQEFFFHLVGAIEVLAKLVNEVRSCGLRLNDVTVPEVEHKLATSDPLKAKLRALYENPRGKDLPSDPYSEQGYLFRLYNYRHQVTHRGSAAFLVERGVSDSLNLILDPRDASRGHSKQSVHEDLSAMFELVERRCRDALQVV